MLNRIDIRIEVPRVDYEKLSGDRLGETSEFVLVSRRRAIDNAERFIAEVDSVAVYVNASTRCTDGTEVAVSTQSLHARGPMALRELTTYKWVIRG